MEWQCQKWRKIATLSGCAYKRLVTQEKGAVDAHYAVSLMCFEVREGEILPAGHIRTKYDGVRPFTYCEKSDEETTHFAKLSPTRSQQRSKCVKVLLSFACQ